MNKNKSDCEKCRLCLIDDEKNDFTSIFDNNESDVSLAVRIMVCLSLPIQSKDSFPRKVCKNCENRITNFYEFREICYNSYYTLLRGNSSYDDEEKYFIDDEAKTTKLVENEVQDEEISRVEKIHSHSEENIYTTAVVSAENEENAQKLEIHRIEPETISNVRVDEKNCEERIFDNDDIGDAEYKCLACEDAFPDLESATIHSALCSNSVEEQQLETEYAEDTLKAEKFSWINKNKLEITDGKRRIGKGKKKEKNLNNFCNNCNGVFSSAALLRRHSVVHTGERPFECSICKKRFSQVGQLNFHKKFHLNPRYRCDVCDKPFLRPSDIEKHMRTHTGEKPYVCKICEKSFAQLVALQQHERIHTGDKPYDCEICGKKFSQKANKTKHLKIHKEGTKPHTCEICGRSFYDIEEMNLHRAGHGGGKPRKCNYCDESFRKMSELGQHVRRYHTFERPHKCAFCQKAFYSLYNLKQHVMVHTGQKPYACSRCDLRFTQKGNLTKHFDRKHVEKSNLVDDINNDRDKIRETHFYACTRCDLKFNDRKHLTDHYQCKHTDNKTNKIKYIIIKRQEITDDKDGVFVLDDNLSECMDDPLVIEHEENLQVVMEDENVHSNLQMYDIAE